MNSRRRFLQSASLGGAAVAAPAFVKASSEYVLRFQSTWPTRDIFHEYALDYAKKVNDMSGGALKIEVLPANSVVKAFALLDAVHKGQLDGGHGVPNYWYAKNTAFCLFGSGPAFGMDGNLLLAWMEYGGGQKLYDMLVNETLKLEVQGFLYGPMPTQPLGWFKRPITSPADLRGLRFRAAGATADLFRELGMTTAALPAADIVPAMDQELIDAAEFNNPSSDRTLGFPAVSKICMLRSTHQTSEVFEVIFNRKRFESLPRELRNIIRYATQASSADMSWKAADRYARDYEYMSKQQGVKFITTPPSVFKTQLDAWRRIVDRESFKNPMFAKIVASQKRFAQRVVGFQLDAVLDPSIIYDFWFGKQRIAQPPR